MILNMAWNQTQSQTPANTFTGRKEKKRRKCFPFLIPVFFPFITGTSRFQRTKWSDSVAALLSLQNWYTLQGAYSNSSPLKIRSFELFWWLLWAKCMLLQVLHEIARVRWRGLWCFGVNTSFELFGGWSRGAIRLLSINLTSSRQLSHTQAYTVGWKNLTGERWRLSERL